MPDSTRYRVVDFIGGRILEAREMMTLQNMTEGLDSGGNVVVKDLNAIYRDGATLNVTPVITPGTTTVTLTPTNNTFPMLVFVHGRWETLRTADAPAITLTAGQTHLYLNWAINVVTSSSDPSLVDATTGESTANMGELDFSVSATDTSATALGGSQLAKNTSPIILFTFAAAGNSLTIVPVDNILLPAYASSSTGGLVKTTTGNSTVVSTDDPRMSGSRPPSNGSVVDASVRAPVSNGNTNPDGSAQYDLTSDPGGISADKIIWQTYKERISDFLAWIRSQISSITTTLSGHVGVGLGLAATHPFPTASQVGAAPLSHVNQALSFSGSSHPPVVNTDSGGFQVNQSTGAGSGANDPAYGVFQNGTYVAGLQHSGDLYSTLLNSIVVNPGGGPINFSGPLTGLKAVAQVLTDHVNQNSHANPHGLTLADLGGSIISVSTESPLTGSAAQGSGQSNGINYLIVRIAPNNGNAIEIAYGVGTVNSNETIPLPNGNFNYSQFLATASVATSLQGGRTINSIECWVSGSQVHVRTYDNNGNGPTVSTAAVQVIAWRTNA